MSEIRQIAVENFLGSLDLSLPIGAHLANLSADARSYKWNAPTVAAIRKGIYQAYESKKE